jgi:PAS domain S-box-containing protein
MTVLIRSGGFLPHMAVSPSTIDSNSLFESAFKHAAIGMALVAPNGRFLRVNRSLCELTGYSDLELMELTFQDITHPDDVNRDVANSEKLLRGEISSYQMEKRYFGKNDAVVWILLTVSLVRGAAGEPLFFISQMKDITGRKEAERQLREHVEEIERLRSGLLTVCAWTKQVQVDGRWVAVDEFLSEHLGLKLTHGMSAEGARLFEGDRERAR